jgi:hypothetical protein
MAIITWRETLTSSSANGNTLIGNVSGSLLNPANRIQLPSCYFYPGRTLQFRLMGVIITSVTSVAPSVRFQICLGVEGTTVVYDTQTVPLVQATRPSSTWTLEVDLVCRSIGIGVATTFMPTAALQCPALIGGPVPTAGGNSSFLVPVDGPALGGGTDSTVAPIVDVFCTCSGAGTGLILANYRLDALN